MNNQPYIHPVHQCDDGIITSYTKRKIDLRNPTEDMICVEDIAKGLANTCRFGGQIENFYSVAQHSVLVGLLGPDHLKKAALLHDASEAYLGDVIKPLKNIISGYAEIEERFERVIFNKFDVDFDLLKQIKPYDKEALSIEYEFIHGQSDKLLHYFEPLKSVFWPSRYACIMYETMLGII